MRFRDKLSWIGLFIGAGVFAAGCPAPEPDPGLNPSPRMFRTLFRFATGTSPSEAEVADLNGDTKKDIVTANRGGNSISVLLADSASGFATKVDYATNVAPAALELADVNKDGILDAITANAGSHDISVLLGVGDGTFQEEQRSGLISGTTPADMIVVDLNGDGNLDVAVAGSGDDTVSILYGVGDGTFGLVPLVIPVGAGPRSIIAVDLDKNLVPDLVTANRNSDSISILFGQPDFTFAAAQNLSVGGLPRMVRAGDIDQDGWDDLVVSNPGTGDLSLLFSEGGGVFSEETRLEVEKLPTRFALQDLDSDGKLDIAVLLFSDGADGEPLGLAAVFKGEDDGAFAAPRYFGAGPAALDIQALKMDSDSRLDLITAGGSTANVIYGRAAAGFESEERFAVGLRPRAIASADFNRDGKLDLAVTNLDSNDVSILPGNGDGTFKPQLVVAAPGIPRAITAGSINSDSNPDFVVTDLNNSRVGVYLGKGDGTFQSVRLVSVREAGVTATSQPRSVVLADMDGDGKADIVTGNANSDSVAIVLGNGDGSFAPAKEFFAGNFPLDVAVRDFNGDGKLDVAVVNGTEPDSPVATAPRVNVIFGNGDGTLDPDSRTSYTTGDGPRGMVVGEFTGDGNLDAVTVHQGNDRVNVLVGRTGGKLTAGTAIRSGFSPNCVTAADVNRDSRLDIMTTNDTESISIQLGLGGANFGAPVSFLVGADPIGGALIDLTGDNRPEAIVANRLTNDISVLTGVQF